MLCEVESIYLHREPVGFRKSINGLSVIVEQQMQLSPFANALFVFCNKRPDKLKVLYWDKTGFALWYKRLEKDKFKWPCKLFDEVIELSEQQWLWLLAGYDYMKFQGHAALQYQSVGL
ncbi:MAG: IS66 family insertion sequence element accessory protein TnpB [Cyanobacteria bacterium P01_F01_bin.86]